MDEIFAMIKERLQQGGDCLLAAVIASSGSTPRSTGAYMLLDASGRLSGTIGGGSLEYNALKVGMEKLLAQKSFIFEYALHENDAADLGMICGGSCTVLFYYLAAKDLPEIDKALNAAKEKKPYWLLLPMEHGLLRLERAVELNARHGIIQLPEGKYYAEQFAYDGKVYIFGGGHLAQETVPLLAHLGFNCIVLDDREEFADPRLFPGAEKVLCVDFKRLGEVISVNADDYLAVMTRGHLHDADVERFALQTAAGYIGVVGSRRKAALTRSVLAAEGFSAQQLDRIITPIGLDIGSETPAEIAVSIAAQLICQRGLKHGVK